MKKFRLIAATLLVALPGIALAQVDTAGKRPAGPGAKKWEIRLGGFMINGQRDAALNNNVTTSTGNLKGVEVLMRAAGAGIQLLAVIWALAQFPMIIPPGLPIDASAAPARVLSDTLMVLGGGAIVLVPSLWYLIRVFKGSD